MTTIHLPGRPDMTPEQYAAWWAGVPVERLELSGPDRALEPPSLSPPQGRLLRRWRVTPVEGGAPSATGRSGSVRVYLPSGIVGVSSLSSVIPGTAQAIGEGDAERLAREFMGARGFATDALGDAKLRRQGTDAKGRTTAMGVQFAGLFGGGGDARLTVDLGQGVVTGATLGLPPPEPSGPRSQYRVSLTEARALLGKALTARGTTHYEIVNAREWHPPYEATLDGPYYMLVVTRDLPAPKGAMGASVREVWLVNGTTGAACRDDELPALKERMEAAYKADEERNRATADPSPAPTP